MNGKESAISVLRFIAWLNLIFGVIAAIVVWITMGTSYISGSHYLTEINPLGIALGFVPLIGGITGCALFLVICLIADYLIRIEHHSVSYSREFRRKEVPRDAKPVATLTPAPENGNDEIDRLKKLAGRDAIRFPYVTETEWICVCGTKNEFDKTMKAQNCWYCHRDRESVFKYIK